MQRSSVLLPEPLGPEQRHDLADAHREIEAVEHVLRAVALGEVLDLDRDIVARDGRRAPWSLFPGRAPDGSVLPGWRVGAEFGIG